MIMPSSATRSNRSRTLTTLPHASAAPQRSSAASAYSDLFVSVTSSLLAYLVGMGFWFACTIVVLSYASADEWSPVTTVFAFSAVAGWFASHE